MSMLMFFSEEALASFPDSKAAASSRIGGLGSKESESH